MGFTGIVRKVDELGRIVLPIELRRSLDIEEHDTLEIRIEEDRIVLRKYFPTCIFCGAEACLTGFRGKRVCQSCIEAMVEENDDMF